MLSTMTTPNGENWEKEGQRADANCYGIVNEMSAVRQDRGYRFNKHFQMRFWGTTRVVCI